MKLVMGFVLFLQVSLISEDIEDRVVNTLQKADKQWVVFNKKLNSHLQKTALDYRKNDQKSVKTGYNQENAKHNLILSRVDELQKSFLKLQKQMREVLSMQIEGRYANSVHAITMLDTTNWYTDYLEKCLLSPQYDKIEEQKIDVTNYCEEEKE